MTHDDAPAYGLWLLVILNSLVFVIFAFSFSKPQSARDWRSFGAFSAFIVALFTEMYGFPLTIYLLSGWLQSRYPGMDLMSHNAGHLWPTLFGLSGNPHFSALHIVSDILIFGGFILLSAAWNVLYQAQRQGELATTGAYAYVRHPQYVGFIIIIMFGFLLQWPTILTMTMFPILVPMYWRVAKAEEREAIASSGDAYRDYMTRVPASSCHASVQPRMNMEPDRKALSLADGHDPRLVRRHSAAEQRQAGNWPLVHLLEAPLSTMNERVRSWRQVLSPLPRSSQR